jgi:hypothetical protein
MRHPVRPPGPAARLLARAGPAKPTGVLVALLSGDGDDRCSSRRDRSGRSLPGVTMGGLAPHAIGRRARASLQDVRHARGSRRSAWGPLGGLGVDPHKGRSWWGGARGRVTRHLLPWRGAESAPRRPAPQRRSSTLAR